jgi:hypothetical protein
MSERLTRMAEGDRILRGPRPRQTRNDGIWRPEDNERLNPPRAALRTEPQYDLECIHCHQRFFGWQSSAADFDLCDYCLHRGD